MTELLREFAGAMARLGPYGAAPKFCVAASGGADSTALALLARDWANSQGAALEALIVDHGLRAGSAAEAALTAVLLTARGIASRILSLGLAAGSGLQEMARAARYEALGEAAAQAGGVFLLLGHHRADQAETVAMRAARGKFGLEGMAEWTARNKVILLRPLLGIPPDRLRAYLAETKMAWIDDPSNTDRRFERVRLRLDGVAGEPAAAAARVAREAEAAAFLAAHVTFRPEGFAVIHAQATPAAALGALVRVIGGADYPPARDGVAALAGALRPASLGGVLIGKTRKFGGGFLVAREPAACAPPVDASACCLWDRRFRLSAARPGATFGALGGDASRFRQSPLPAVVLRGQPCLREGTTVTYPCAANFKPPAPATTHPFEN